MVYESDFYTTRRPGTYRPSTSYSVSVPLRYIPIHSLGKVHAVSAYYPTYVPGGGQRLIMSRTAPHKIVTIRVRPSVVIRELDRIEHKHRSSIGYSATEEFLCSNTSKDWEDESRKIRAQTSALLQRIHNAVPRATSVAPITTLSRYNDPILPAISSKFSFENYLDRMVMPIRNVARDIISRSWYPEPLKRFTGRTHLSCVKYAGPKAQSTRRPMYHEMSIRDDVNLLSFYAKNRLAAVGLALESVTVKLLPDRPSRKFQPPMIMDDPGKELKAAKAERLERFRTVEPSPVDNAAEAERLAERKKKRQEEAKLAEERAIAEELALKKKEQARRDEAARASELARQEELAAQAASDRAAELEKKAEQAKKDEEAAKLAEEAKKVEEAKLAEEAKKAEKAKKARLAEEAKLAEAAKLAEEARLAEEAKKAEEAKLAEEARLAEEEEQRQKELSRLAELEKLAGEEQEAELARQASELAEIARQESELAALAKQEAELAELERQEAELANEASAAAVEESAPEVEEPVVAEEIEEIQAEPQIEEPETPEVQNDEDAPLIEEVSVSQGAEGDVTEEEE
ncbi:uncharacterized protein LOC143918698 isoform X2 [Arctopsyche grandis]|uniref:uncharacterized protein LOC143918698 isoform X2 n=1 Tax=Arctopsyche grandis TaxID=121162 RepID=UPI00406D8A9A